jgi:hypothetical protein
MCFMIILPVSSLGLLHVAQLHPDGSGTLHSSHHPEHPHAPQAERNGKGERT